MSTKDNKKILTICFVAAGALVALVVGLLIETFSSTWAVVARAVDNDFVRHILPVLLGLGTFSALQFNQKVVQYSDEVLTEISRVVWPSRKDTFAMTIVVCLMVVVAGLALSFFDVFASYLIKQLVN